MQGTITDDGSLTSASDVNAAKQAVAEKASPREYWIWLSNSTRFIALSSVGLADRVKAACVDFDYGPTRANIQAYDAIETIHAGVRKDRKASPSSDSTCTEHTEQFTLSKRCKRLDYHNAGD